MKKSKQFLKFLHEFRQSHPAATPREVLAKFSLHADVRDWAFSLIPDGGPFTCPNIVRLPECFLTRLRVELISAPGMTIRNLYQKKGFPKLLIGAAIEDGHVIEVIDPHQATAPQRLLFWAETHSALAKGTQAAVDRESKRRKKEAEVKARQRRDAKYVNDVKGFAIDYAARYFPHLTRWHEEEVNQIALLAEYFFVGDRISVKVLSLVLNRRYYHESKELGWRRLKDGRFVRDDEYNEREEFDNE